MKSPGKPVPASARLEGKGTTNADAKWRAGIETLTARYREMEEAKERWLDAERSRHSAEPRKPHKAKSPPRRDYREQDAPLVDEAIAGIKSGMYADATDAARALAKRAAGHGTGDSKVARLAKRVRRDQRLPETEHE